MKNNMYLYESRYLVKGFKTIAGLDEVGRGAWAGPVVVAAVVLPPGYRNDKINDSKKLSAAMREKLFHEIIKNAITYSINWVFPKDVDKMNPKKATIYAMEQAVNDLSVKPDYLLIDFEKINTDIQSLSITKGDEKSISIAAASIVAKHARDEYMKKMDKKYPSYGFDKHKGYGTVAHLKAIKKYGLIPNFHRLSYKLPINANSGKQHN